LCLQLFVPGCKSGYRSNKSEEKRHFFKPGKKFLESWEIKIPRKDRELRYNSNICDVHFEERFIIKTFKHHINGQLVEIEREKWTLTSDAYPTIFPNLPKYLTRKLPKERNSPSKRINYVNEKENKLPKESKFTENVETASIPTVILQQEETNVNTDEILPELTTESSISTNKYIVLLSTSSGNSTGMFKCKEQVYSLRKQLKNCRKIKKNLREENRQLKRRMLKLQKELESHQLNKTNLPYRQKLLISNAVHLSHCKNKCRMRYDIEWILECVLLRIRSPENYEFMRKNNYMPLPDCSTLRKYISGIDARFVFDPELFDRLKDKIA
ncbi:uncharacterized protein LOC111619757, partial [Centruroides sculpturatus]|uniref:uncharacterized protein LOC111619757 n=1 Tax=Centruroides sculpturatus TaxID=218467 RepID=UPI000C6E36F6